MASQERKTPLLLLPFAIVWAIFTFVMKLTGRILAGLIGLALLVVGILLTLSFFAAPVGIPMALVGLLLLVRSLF